MTRHPPSSAALPPGHFLALPPTFSNDPRTSLTTASHAAPGLAPNVASLAAADFDVDVRTGFLPPGGTVERLPAPYDVWEDALEAARGAGPGDGLRLGGGSEREIQWRDAVAGLDVLAIDGLADLPLLRRAHLVLAFLAHFYVHCAPADAPVSGPKSGSSTDNGNGHAANGSVPTPTAPAPRAPEIPASISVPLLAISPLVGLPPILTYADTVLWNVLPEDPTHPTNMATNPPARTLASFTNTKSEAGFYLVSAECEAAGAAALALMRQSLDELFLADDLALRRLTVYLRQLAVQIDRVGDITLRMMTEVDPEEFYHLIRPWFKGGDADGPQSPGWLFLGVDDTSAVAAAENRFAPQGEGKKFSGPSAGQSSLVHAFDIFLTVDHAPRMDEDATIAAGTNDGQPVLPADIRLNADPIHPTESESEESGESDLSRAPTPPGPPNGHRPGPPIGRPPRHAHHPSGPVEATFLNRMLQYMPLPHRTFLLHLSSHPTPLRPLVMSRAETHPALADAYDGALAALRRFRDKHMRVVSRFIVVQARRTPTPRIQELLGESLRPAAGDDKKEVNAEELRGTGGTPLIRFLKRCRDNTSRAMVTA